MPPGIPLVRRRNRTGAQDRRIRKAMSDIVKKGFFRRCIYRATGAYLLEQHIQQLEQQLEQATEYVYQNEE